MLKTAKRKLKKIVRAAQNLCFGYYLKQTQLNEAIATEVLEAYSPDPGTSPICKNQLFEPRYDLTVIIPVYNVENFVSDCLISVLQQKTRYTFNVIAVDDGSTDGSAEILKSFYSWENFHLITQKNSGQSSARNAAMRELHSEYVMFVDSDDILMDGAIEELISAAKQNKADIVQGGCMAFENGSGKVRDVVRYKSESQVSPNGVLIGMPWGKVYRSALFENICFPVGYIYEDTIITGIITHLASNIATITSPVYRYRLHKRSITNTVRVSPKAVHTLWVNLCVLKARQALGLKNDKEFYMHLLRLVVLSQARLRTQSRKIQYCVFILLRKMLIDSSVGLDLDTMDAKYKRLERAILDRKYFKYLYLCGTW